MLVQAANVRVRLRGRLLHLHDADHGVHVVAQDAHYRARLGVQQHATARLQQVRIHKGDDAHVVIGAVGGGHDAVVVVNHLLHRAHAEGVAPQLLHLGQLRLGAQSGGTRTVRMHMQERRALARAHAVVPPKQQQPAPSASLTFSRSCLGFSTSWLRMNSSSISKKSLMRSSFSSRSRHLAVGNTAAAAAQTHANRHQQGQTREARPSPPSRTFGDLVRDAGPGAFLLAAHAAGHLGFEPAGAARAQQPKAITARTRQRHRAPPPRTSSSWRPSSCRPPSWRRGDRRVARPCPGEGCPCRISFRRTEGSFADFCGVLLGAAPLSQRGCLGSVATLLPLPSPPSATHSAGNTRFAYDYDTHAPALAVTLSNARRGAATRTYTRTTHSHNGHTHADGHGRTARHRRKEGRDADWEGDHPITLRA